MDFDTAAELQAELHKRGVGSLVQLESPNYESYKVRHTEGIGIGYKTLEVLMALARTFDCRLFIAPAGSVLRVEFTAA